MKRGPVIHAVLLIAALLFAYQTWTREEKVDSKTGDIKVWSLPKDSVTGVVFDTKDKSVRLEKRQEGNETYFWGSQTRITRKTKKPPQPQGDAGVSEAEPVEEVDTATTEFMTNDEVAAMVSGLTELMALRDLGSPSDEDLKVYGLVDSQDNITVSHGGGSRGLVVGGKVYGGSDRYVREPESGRVYVVAGAVLTDLLTGESALRLRDMHGFKPDEVDKAVVTAGGKTRSLVRVTVTDDKGVQIKNWADAATPDKTDQTMSNFLENVDKVKATTFEPGIDAASLVLLVKVEYQRADGKGLGWFELYEKTEPAEEPAKDAAGGAAGAEGQAADQAGAAAGEGSADAAADKPPGDLPPPEKPKKNSYYVRTERTRTYASAPLSMSTRIAEDIAQLFTE